MWCTEQKFICYNSKKRKNHDDINLHYKEIKNKEINNKSEIKNENLEEIKIEEKNTIKNEIKENNKNAQDSINSMPIIEDNVINNMNDKDNDKESDDSDDNIPYRNLEMLRELTPYLQTKNNPNFNFPEVKENIYRGKGLRKWKDIYQ